MTVCVVVHVASPWCPQDLNSRFTAAAAAGGAWVTYPWRNSAGGSLFTKAAYVVPVTGADGTAYYAGVGFDQTAAPTAVPCDASTDAPCSNVNALSLTGHAASMASTAMTATALSDVWTAVTSGSTYKVSTGFYVFAYDFSGMNVAHGGNSDNVGKSLQAILDAAGIVSITGAALNAKFVAAANGGGGYVSYPWGVSGGPVSTKTSYVAKVVQYGAGVLAQEYYVGSGFNVAPLAVVPDCNANFFLADSSCQTTNSLSLFGQAQSSLNRCGGDWSCFQSVLWDITYSPTCVTAMHVMSLWMEGRM